MEVFLTSSFQLGEFYSHRYCRTISAILPRANAFPPSRPFEGTFLFFAVGRFFLSFFGFISSIDSVNGTLQIVVPDLSFLAPFLGYGQFRRKASI